jgi:hypothetical protein
VGNWQFIQTSRLQPGFTGGFSPKSNFVMESPAEAG